MSKTTVMMPSSTHAFSARRAFTKNGFECQIKRAVRPSRNGCSYYILVNTDSDTAVSLLDKYGIRHGEPDDALEDDVT